MSNEHANPETAIRRATGPFKPPREAFHDTLSTFVEPLCRTLSDFVVGVRRIGRASFRDRGACLQGLTEAKAARFLVPADGASGRRTVAG